MSERMKAALKSADPGLWHTLLQDRQDMNTANAALTETAVFLQFKFNRKTEHSIARVCDLDTERLKFGPGSPAKAFGHGAMRAAAAMQVISNPPTLESFDVALNAVDDIYAVSQGVQDMSSGRYAKGIGRVIKAAKAISERLKITEELGAIHEGVANEYPAMFALSDHFADESKAHYNADFRDFALFGSIACFATYISVFEGSALAEHYKLGS